MNERIKELALEAGLLNYADMEEVEKKHRQSFWISACARRSRRMNKRIEEIGKKSADHPDMFGLYHFSMEELDRFAKLIVEECIKKIDDMIDDGWYADTDKLKQHLGVEE